MSVVLAFNSIGWKPQNVLFNAIDAIVGDPLISSAFNGQQPSEALAYIRDSGVPRPATSPSRPGRPR